MHRSIHPEPRRMDPARGAQIDRLGARWVFGIMTFIDVVAFGVGETGLGLLLGALLLASAISQIPARKIPATKDAQPEPEAVPKWLRRHPEISEERAARLTGGPAIACGIAALFLLMWGVSVVVG